METNGALANLLPMSSSVFRNILGQHFSPLFLARLSVLVFTCLTFDFKLRRVRRPVMGQRRAEYRVLFTRSCAGRRDMGTSRARADEGEGSFGWGLYWGRMMRRYYVNTVRLSTLPTAQTRGAAAGTLALI